MNNDYILYELDENEINDIEEKAKIQYPPFVSLTKPNRFNDLSNNIYGRLKVLYRGENDDRGSKPRTMWICVCMCEEHNIVKYRGDDLTRGKRISCGCLHNTNFQYDGTTHGDSYNRLYSIYSAMKKRCNNPNDQAYENYGGRGIKVCDEWKNDYSAFKKWALNNGYQDDLSIDRIEVNGNYEPGNCRWTTMKEQSNNRRNNRLLTVANKTQTVSQWANERGINVATLFSRIQNGWTVLEALEFVKRGEK